MRVLRSMFVVTALSVIPLQGRSQDVVAGMPRCACAVELREFAQGSEGRELPWLRGAVTPKEPTTRVAERALGTLTCEHADHVEVRELQLRGDAGSKTVFSAWVRLTNSGRSWMKAIRTGRPDASVAVVCDGTVVGAVRLDAQTDEGIPLGMVDRESAARALAANLEPRRTP